MCIYTLYIYIYIYRPLAVAGPPGRRAPGRGRSPAGEWLAASGRARYHITCCSMIVSYNML